MKTTGKTLCMILVLCLFLSAAPASAYDISDFSDVPVNHWAYPYIRACARADIIQGVSRTRFAPESALTSEQFLTLLGRACYEKHVRASANENDTWSSAYIRVAGELGLLENVGIEDMSKPIRRCDMAMLLFNVCTRLQGKSEEGVTFGERLPSGYDTGKYAKAIGFCYGAGLLSGSTDGFFHGDKNLTRAQAARVIAQLAGLEPQPHAPTNELYILMYHSVVPDVLDCNEYMTNASQFRADLQWMAEHGYTTVLPGELAAGKPLPQRAVLITFDDGYLDNYKVAFPLLKEFGAKAVIAPIVQMVDVKYPDVFSWEMAREMLASELVEIGSHTYFLHDAEGIGRRDEESRQDYEERVFTDIETSIELLESNLGRKVNFFAYPNGRTDEWASDFLRQRFAVTVTTREDVASIPGDLHDLPRFSVNSVRTARSILPE